MRIALLSCFNGVKRVHEEIATCSTNAACDHRLHECQATRFSFRKCLAFGFNLHGDTVIAPPPLPPP